MKKRSLIVKIAAIANAIFITAVVIGCPARKDHPIVTIAPPARVPTIAPPTIAPPTFIPPAIAAVPAIAPYGFSPPASPSNQTPATPSSNPGNGKPGS